MKFDQFRVRFRVSVRFRELGKELGLSTYIRGKRVKSNELKKQGRMC